MQRQREENEFPLTIFSPVASVSSICLCFEGAMGKRTVHQVDAKAQLVVMATRSRVVGDAKDGDGMDRKLLGLDAVSAENGDVSVKETAGLKEEEDVYVAPVLVGEEGEVRAGAAWQRLSEG